MTLRTLAIFGFVLAVLAMPVAADAQGVVPGDQKGASQLVVSLETDEQIEEADRQGTKPSKPLFPRCGRHAHVARVLEPCARPRRYCNGLHLQENREPLGL